MNDEARERLRAALNALTPPAGSLSVPDLPHRQNSDRWREAVAVGTAFLLALAVVGSLIWFRTHTAARTPASPSGSVPASAAPHTATPSPAATIPVAVVPPPSSAPAATPRCHTGDLAATLRALSPGAGQRYAALVLTNSSGHACQVYGYVGMLLLDVSHQPVPTNVVRSSPPGPRW